MNRTQIYLPKSQQVALNKIAQRRGSTVSALIRAAIQEKLMVINAPKTDQKTRSLFEAARKINKLGQVGPRDLAANLDKYLYGEKK